MQYSIKYLPTGNSFTMPDLAPENTNTIREEPGEDELTAIVHEYPYYSLGQFRLLANYKKNNHRDFDRQASVTSLFFSNQKWLSWQLARENTVEKKEEIISANELESKEKPAPVPAVENDALPAFEPLHTRDYFASQGIKISEEASPPYDKLGAQLKSFTEWLKSMKKINEEKIEGGDEETDKAIRNIAEGSNVNISVVTEAMAEVLLHQGKAEQAIAVYNKLSLNYPARSAYFAAKINSLKTV